MFGGLELRGAIPLRLARRRGVLVDCHRVVDSVFVNVQRVRCHADDV